MPVSSDASTSATACGPTPTPTFNVTVGVPFEFYIRDDVATILCHNDETITNDTTVDVGFEYDDEGAYEYSEISHTADADYFNGTVAADYEGPWSVDILLVVNLDLDTSFPAWIDIFNATSTDDETSY